MKENINVIKIFFIFLLLLTLSEVKSVDYIEIPFKRNIVYNDTLSYVGIVEELEKCDLYSEIEIGTPPQKVFLNPKISFYYSFIISEKPNITNDKVRNLDDDYKNKIFNCTKSSTYKNNGSFNFMSTDFKFTYHMEDTFYFNNKQINNLPMIQAVESISDNYKSIYSGILGFGSMDYSGHTENNLNLIKNLKEMNIINSYDFFMEYDNLESGKIIIGCNPNQYNPKKYPYKNYTITKIPSSGQYTYWGLYVNKIYLNGELIDSPSEGVGKASFLWEFGYIGFNTKIQKVLENFILNDLKKDHICYQITNRDNSISYVCEKDKLDKSKFPIMHIYNEELNYNFTLDLSKMFIDYGKFSMFLLQFKYTYTYEFGQPFFASNIFFWNQDKKYLGVLSDKLSEEKEIIVKEKNNFKFAFFISFLLFTLLTALLLFILYRTCKRIKVKRRGIELVEDNYEYLQDNKNKLKE